MSDVTATNLPIAACLPALLDSLAANPNAVLVAPPGAGKTTTVPLALLDAAWCGGGRIVMLEPRRLAARAAASRMASLIGEAVGGTVGYRTRLDSAVSAATRIEVVTEGLLVRRLLGDPGLTGVAAVVFDEVHERGLDADLALAFCLDVQREYRPELRLLAMSATADGARLSALMAAPVIESAGRAFPVELRHAARDLGSARDLAEAMARAVRAALAEHASGDVLAFLPGMGEIRRVQAALAGVAARVLVPITGTREDGRSGVSVLALAASSRRCTSSTAVACSVASMRPSARSRSSSASCARCSAMAASRLPRAAPAWRRVSTSGAIVTTASTAKASQIIVVIASSACPALPR